MRLFVMSDLHGRYHTFLAMLETIGFREDDILYILGDLCDRGPYAAQLYLDVMDRKNVYCTMGNHEHMALDDIVNFVQRYRDYSREDRQRIYDFMESLPLLRQIQVNNYTYLLCHTITDQHGQDAQLREYTPWDFLWERPEDFDTRLQIADLPKDTAFIIGHTPTMNLRPGPPTVFFGKGNIINVDCGAGFPQYGGRLGCLCLNDLSTYYLDIVKEDQSCD